MILTSRPATLDDWARLYAWRSDPGTCAAFLSPPPPSLASHLAWLQLTLRDPSCRLMVASDGPHAVGTYRLDADGFAVWCSVTVDPRYRGRGYAVPMLQMLLSEARQVWPAHPVRAWIKNGNVASLRAFATAGFTVRYGEGTVSAELERRHEDRPAEVYLVDDIDPCNDMGRR